MHVSYKRCCKWVLVLGLLLGTLFHFWGPSSDLEEDLRPRRGSAIQALLSGKIYHIMSDYSEIPYKVKENVARELAQNTCICLAGEETFHLPFSDLLFHRVWAHNLQHAFLETRPDPDNVKNHRAEEYHHFQKRSYSPVDMLIIAEANNPLQYPTQGLEVQPLKTVIIPGLGLRQEDRGNYMFETEGHQSFFTIKVGHRVVPKLYNSGQSEGYNITSLVTIATKTFLRYDKLKDLIDSIRQFYPTVTIVIADDNEHPQPVTGPHIEQYIMPFGKGWFAGRNLAVSQVSTKYVLWVDDDFIFTANTQLEKMVDILEKTTLDLVS
ncbi:beta-1,4 N-acetylgalactosaminyltransferase 1-like isoform X3 [Cyprinodon tularosa]|uniref:beta-1,4 N-acetylgalactosaminyltransferase 1-like isoform X3 n=1 Tax=Cyprinodon tularosa TaxID=77115 RepID=UPI0018E1E5B5|nr:beta-1,4 N-acetylgalactosaminyltransferase 1-like isoform X3 [Cyprinodon tularosa]